MSEATPKQPEAARQRGPTVTLPAAAGWLLVRLDAGGVVSSVVCVDFHQPRFEAVPGARFLGPAQLKEAA